MKLLREYLTFKNVAETGVLIVSMGIAELAASFVVGLVAVSPAYGGPATLKVAEDLMASSYFTIGSGTVVGCAAGFGEFAKRSPRVRKYFSRTLSLLRREKKQNPSAALQDYTTGLY